MLALAVLGEGPARRIEEGREHNAPLPSDLKKEELYLFKMFKIFILCVSEHFENLLNKQTLRSKLQSVPSFKEFKLVAVVGGGL